LEKPAPCGPMTTFALSKSCIWSSSVLLPSKILTCLLTVSSCISNKSCPEYDRLPFVLLITNMFLFSLFVIRGLFSINAVRTCCNNEG
jgi:hypothetical protein